MNTQAEEQIRMHLFELQDKAYRDFNSKLIPNIALDTQIGIRTPALRKYAKELAKTPEAMAFLDSLPHKYYEENNLHGFLLETIKDYDTAIRYIDAFLPHINNWSTCDCTVPKVFKKHPAALLAKVKEWIASDHTYTIRYGIGTLMRCYLDEQFQPAYLDLVASVKSEEYYVNMMIAWYFATALAKQYDATLPYIERRVLEPWTHRKTIQKAIESYRITPEQKSYLRTLK